MILEEGNHDVMVILFNNLTLDILLFPFLSCFLFSFFLVFRILDTVVVQFSTCFGFILGFKKAQKSIQRRHGE